MDITLYLGRRPVKSKFADGIRKVVIDCDCAERFCPSWRKILVRLGLEPCGNGVVTRLYMRSKNTLHSPQTRGFSHGSTPPRRSPGHPLRVTAIFPPFT